MGHFLKAFRIDFSLHHLGHRVSSSSCVENYGDKQEDSMFLRQVCDKVNPFIPTQMEVKSLIETEKGRSLVCTSSACTRKLCPWWADIKVYMSFTINLDTYLREVIKDEHGVGHVFVLQPQKFPQPREGGVGAAEQVPADQA